MRPNQTSSRKIHTWLLGDKGRSFASHSSDKVRWSDCFTLKTDSPRTFFHRNGRGCLNFWAPKPQFHWRIPVSTPILGSARVKFDGSSTPTLLAYAYSILTVASWRPMERSLISWDMTRTI